MSSFLFSFLTSVSLGERERACGSGCLLGGERKRRSRLMLAISRQRSCYERPQRAKSRV